MSLLDDFRRVSRSHPCPVCQHADWCMTTRDDPPSCALCTRVESPRRWGEVGWFHRLRDDGWRTTRTVRIMRTIASPPCAGRIHELVGQFQSAVPPERLDELARDLGVTVASLRRLGIGWTQGLWAFPMQNPSRRGVVCGIRYRTPGGAKFSESGGKEGLFIPTGLSWTGPLLLPEGPTDTAATLDAGFDAVGRPNCSGGARQIRHLIAEAKPPSVVVVADADEPGQKGAAAIARALLLFVRDVRVVTPPVKDMREWVRNGATRDDVQRLIDSVPPMRLRVVGRGTIHV